MNNYKIAEARTAKGWSQSEFAKRLGTTQQQVARYESGENDVKSSIIVKMSKVLGVTISYLLGLDDAPAAPDSDPDFDRLARNYRALGPEGRAALVATSDALAERLPPAPEMNCTPKLGRLK